MPKKSKIALIFVSVILVVLLILGVSYAYFTAKITGNESASTVVITAAYLELTFTDGNSTINAEDIIPGWSASKTFTVENTGNSTAYYVIKVTDITNTFTVANSISLKITSSDGGGNVVKQVLPLTNTVLTNPIEIKTSTTHNYTVTTYYNNLETDQLPDLGAIFSYTISIEAVSQKVMPAIYNESVSGTLLAGIRSNYASPTSTLTTPGQINSTSSEKIMASTADDYGTSYYFRGTVENNYVVFAKMCWRIVRIDGLGNIKLVLYNYNSDKENVTNPCASTYDGESNAFARYDGTKYTSAFNSSAGSNAYVGLMYGSTDENATYEETHANTNKSTILTNLETWYDNNLANYESKLADVIWCNDKSLASKQLGGQTGFANTGIGTAKTWYGATERLVSESTWAASSSATPTLVCPDASTNDDNYKNISRYTVDEDEYGGNGALDKKIGLLTADEIAFAGAIYNSSNSSYYLNKNASSYLWWSASPFRFNGDLAYEWYVYSSGHLYTNYVNYAGGFRPAVSLVSTVTMATGGEGTQAKPFVVQ